MQKNQSTLIDDDAKADPTDLMKQYQTSNGGLSQAEADKRLEKYGANTIRQGKRKSELLIFLENFTSLMAILLWVSGLIAMFAGMLELGIAIWAVNVINGCFSYWQQHAAQKATDSLKKMLRLTLKFAGMVSLNRLRSNNWYRGIYLTSKPEIQFQLMPESLMQLICKLMNHH